MSKQIVNALLSLDPNNELHWTNNGSPKISALNIPNLTRAEVTAVAPQFTRENRVVDIVSKDEDIAPKETISSSTDDKDLSIVENSMEKFIDYDGKIYDLVELTKITFDNTGYETKKEWNALSDEDKYLFIQDTIEQLDLEEFIEEQPVAPIEEKDPLQILLSNKKIADGDLAKAEQALNSAQKHVELCRKKVDECEDKLTVERKSHTTQHDIMFFIESQRKLRAQRFERHNNLIRQGLDLSRIGASPIDKAMARKNTRGSQRPVRKTNTE